MDLTQSIGIVYCGISLVCAFILILEAHTVASISSRKSLNSLVLLTYLSAGLTAIFDCAYALRETVGISFPPAWSYILTLAYVMCANFTGIFWIIYAEKKQNSWFFRKNLRMNIFMIPLYALVAITLSTPLTHWFFYFEGSSYKRGSLFSIVSVFLLVYVAQSGIKSLIRSFKKKNYADRYELRRLFIYAFAYLLIQALQIVLPDIFPYRSVGTMIIFTVFLLQRMKEQIGIDPLTHINNRYAIDSYLGSLMNSNQKFEIVILDIDKFKSINDSYGHNEGDLALKYVAQALAETVTRGCFYARWGGDEFVIINNDMNHSIIDVEDELNANLKNIFHRYNCVYYFTISAGYVLNESNSKSIPDLLALADSELYARKTAKKQPTNA